MSDIAPKNCSMNPSTMAIESALYVLTDIFEKSFSNYLYGIRYGYQLLQEHSSYLVCKLPLITLVQPVLRKIACSRSKWIKCDTLKGVLVCFKDQECLKCIM